MTALKYVLLLLLMSHYVPVSSEDACHESKLGKVPHPTSCDKYYECDNFIGKEKTCPAGQHFSARSKGCIPIRQSGCGISTTRKTTPRRAQPPRPIGPGSNLRPVPGSGTGSGSGHVGRPNCIPNEANLGKFMKYDHMGTTYYTSKDHYSDAAESAAMCKSICGHLSEIEDKKKDELVHDLLKRLNYGGFLIEGTNKYDRSKWESERTQKNINYLSWCRGEPNNHVKDESCLTYMKNWACMWDSPCVYDYTGFDIHYLCEVNHL